MKVFLLGGCDLEMCTIKKLLKKYNQKFYDKNLKWGAKLSDYKKEIEKHKNDTIYAIELEKDIEADVIEIDHHNENSDKPSSLKQLARLLGYKLNRFEEAVSLNDSFYIDGMLGKFNIEDIKRIRRLDRKCQGVSEIEEEAAKKVELKNRIIEFNYEHFSPLNDRIYFEKGWKKYIIFNEKLTMFYGFNIERLRQYLKENKITPSFWGGGERGFLGVEKKLDKDFLKGVYQKMKSIKSAHIFMFPFVIKDVDNFKQNIEKEWERKEFNFKKVEYFNDFVYFYPHVRDVLFGINNKSEMSIYYDKRLEKNKENKYVISLKSGKKYELEIEDISLRVFNDAIGVLSFHLNNYDYDESYDILKINDFGRRIFPQFLGKDDFISSTKNNFLANRIDIIIGGEHFSTDDFSNFNKENFKNITPQNINYYLIPNFIKKLIGNEIEIILDDRMFVISFYLDNGKVIDNLVKFDEEKKEYGYLENDWWYKYVFVDGGYKTCQSKIMCKNLIEKSTYNRWVDEGTLWGISRYSFVGIAKKSWFSENILLTHSKTIYYQIMMLLLMYRAMIVYFSNEVQNIVEKMRDIKEIKESSKKLYKEYLKFLNGLYFREVTTQDQGIELYKKALEIMEIENQIKDFDREISELDSYIEIEVEKERNEELDKLNKIATFFLPPTFIASFMGMNVGYFQNDNPKQFVFIIFLLILSSVMSWLLFSNKNNQKKIAIILGIIIAVCLILIGLNKI